MSKASTLKEAAIINNDIGHKSQEITPFDLRLVTKKIKIKFSAYKISTQSKNMAQSESIAISHKGVLFSADSYYEKGTLMRVWVEIPDYWSRKSKHVDYRHTEAPTHFQILSRVVNCEEQNLSARYHVLCENLNIDTIDESVLQDYLVSSAGANHK
jgi:hypothetical protein